MGGPGSGNRKERPMEEGETRFVEPEKQPKKGPDRFPAAGRIKCKVYNVENPGEDIVGKVNGIHFSIQHGEAVSLHPSQIQALQNALIDTEEWQELPGENRWEKRALTKPRFMVNVMGGS